MMFVAIAACVGIVPLLLLRYAVQRTPAAPVAAAPTVGLPPARRPADFPVNLGVISVDGGTEITNPDGSKVTLDNAFESIDLEGAGVVPGATWWRSTGGGLCTLLSDGSVSFETSVFS